MHSAASSPSPCISSKLSEGKDGDKAYATLAVFGKYGDTFVIAVSTYGWTFVMAVST